MLGNKLKLDGEKTEAVYVSHLPHLALLTPFQTLSVLALANIQFTQKVRNLGF